MNKKELRILYKNKRASLSEALCDIYSIEIANNVLKLPIWDCSLFHVFLTIEKLKEVDTHYILDILFGKDKDIVVSKTLFDKHTMENYLLTEQTKLKNNNLGIPEPISGIRVESNQIDVVFVPLLAYDRKGNRVGYGKGFYDSFFRECKEEVIKVGLSFFEPENEIIDADSYDIPLNYCVTPEKIYKF